MNNNNVSSKIWKKGAVTELVDNVEKWARKNGLTLSRWQNNKSGRSVEITYSIHKGKRPQYSRDVVEEVAGCILKSHEGTTERCKAYKSVFAMYIEAKEAIV